jgi:galactose mutarotase-like enzyme
MEELKNEYLTIKVAEMGAELQSIKDAQGKEYLWQADPNFWPRRSPILFPIVCSVENDTYYVEGKEYHLPRHGFARDMEFKLVNRTPERLTFALHESEETLKAYPYRFNLAISYRLDGNIIHVVWHVQNTDTKEIHFQIGGHPAFNVPGMKAGEALNGSLRLDNKEPLDGLKSYIDGSHEMTEVPVEAENGIIEFSDNTFRDDSVKIHKCQTHQVELLNKAGKPEVTIGYKAPVIAFWSPFGLNAPFVCIEPWYGLGDPRGYKGEFKDKPLMNHLQPGASFMTEYTIKIS